MEYYYRVYDFFMRLTWGSLLYLPMSIAVGYFSRGLRRARVQGVLLVLQAQLPNGSGHQPLGVGFLPLHPHTW